MGGSLDSISSPRALCCLSISSCKRKRKERGGEEEGREGKEGSARVGRGAKRPGAWVGACVGERERKGKMAWVVVDVDWD